MALGISITVGIEVIICIIIFLYPLIKNGKFDLDYFESFMPYVLIIVQFICLVLFIILIVNFYKGDFNDYINYIEYCTINENQYNYLYVDKCFTLNIYCIVSIVIVSILSVISCGVIFVLGYILCSFGDDD